MKAKVIKTGEVVEVYHTPTNWVSEDLNKIRFFEESELDFSFEDWEAFRREAAKDILIALVSVPSVWKEYLIKSLAKSAIMQADELIKQLREEKK